MLHSAGVLCCLSDACDPIKLVTVSMDVQPLCLIVQCFVGVMQDLLLLSSVHWQQAPGLSSRQRFVNPWQKLGMQHSTNQRQVSETRYPFSVDRGNHMSPKMTSHAPCASALRCLGQALLFRYSTHLRSYITKQCCIQSCAVREISAILVTAIIACMGLKHSSKPLDVARLVSILSSGVSLSL